MSGIRRLDPHDRVTVVYSYSDVHVSGLDLQVRPFFLRSVSALPALTFESSHLGQSSKIEDLQD